MGNASFLLVVFLLVIQPLLPKTMAVRITPNADGLMIENHRTRTRTRQNYMVQRALEDELSASLDNVAPITTDGDVEISPEELSSQIVDYANMIRNDVIFLDNSVETTTRKRGNINKKNREIKNQHCSSCESEKGIIELGDNYYPRRLESLKCLSSNSEESCAPYRCSATYYWIPVLKRASSPKPQPVLESDMPQDLRLRWEPQRIKVIAACVCTDSVVSINRRDA